jgi:hypothetical protein
MDVMKNNSNGTRTKLAWRSTIIPSRQPQDAAHAR